MQRRLDALARHPFDVVVVGGGIYGACLAWEAVSRGLSVALLEKGDFCSGTSAHMHRILHGGFRYLRNADVKRIRESVRERNTLMRLAPHLADPLPFLVPTCTSGLERRELMRVALALYDALAFGRNRGIDDPGRQIPRGRIVSTAECLRLAPGLDPNGVTGGAIWYDGALRDPQRLVLEFIHTAALAGAAVANHVEVTGFLRSAGRVTGVRAQDRLSTEAFDVRGQAVVVAAGPWTESLLGGLDPAHPRARLPYVRSVDIVTRPLTRENHGLALRGPSPHAPEQQIRYFLAPWRGLSVIGSVDYLESADPDAYRIESHELERLVEVVGAAMPGAGLKLDDVLCVQAGLIPHEGTPPLDDPYHAARHYRIADHAREGAVGLFSVLGIKYTTARDVAQKTIDRVVPRLGRAAGPSRSARSPLHGGAFEDLARLVRETRAAAPHVSAALDAERLVRSYGSSTGELFALLGEDARWAEPLAPGCAVTQLEVVYAVREEMAHTLADVVLRRTELGAVDHPGSAALHACAQVMAPLLGWSAQHIDQQLAETQAALSRFWARPRPAAAAGLRG